MNKKILAIMAIGGLVAGVCSQVTAGPGPGIQTGGTIILPTEGGSEGDAWIVKTDGTAASVSQTVSLKLPQATALHLSTTNLTFNLETLGQKIDPDAGKRVCVYAADKNTVSGNVADVEEMVSFNGVQTKTTKPLGTQYELIAGSWPKIQIADGTHGGRVESYPPIRLDDKNNLIPASKNHFVCYSTFILQKFSNGIKWNLEVERQDKPTPGITGRINDLYIQDNPCHEAGGINLQKVPEKGTKIKLLQRGVGTTGSIVSSYLNATPQDTKCGTKSWLDDLVIVAVKIDGEASGVSTATLEYTLTTTQFPTGPTQYLP
jgi:hypothetical protein